jgi:hypothetical protein
MPPNARRRARCRRAPHDVHVRAMGHGRATCGDSVLIESCMHSYGDTPTDKRREGNRTLAVLALGNLKPMSQRIAVVHIDSIMRDDARPTGDAWHNGRVVADLRGGLHATLKQGPYDTLMDECITHGQTAFRDKMRHPGR